MFSQRIDAHIELRMPDVADATALYALVEADRSALAQWLPWAENMSVQDESEFIQSFREKMAGYELWGAIIVVDQQVAGMIDLHAIDATNRRAEVGYWLASAFQGRGVMTKVLASVEQIAFEEYHIDRLAIFVDTENEPSQAVAKRRGFEQEAVLKHYLWEHGQPRDMIVYVKLGATSN